MTFLEKYFYSHKSQLSLQGVRRSTRVKRIDKVISNITKFSDCVSGLLWVSLENEVRNDCV